MSYIKDYVTKIVRTRHIVHFSHTASAIDIKESLTHVPDNARLVDYDDEYACSAGGVGQQMALIFEEERVNDEKTS